MVEVDVRQKNFSEIRRRPPLLANEPNQVLKGAVRARLYQGKTLRPLYHKNGNRAL
jgi:hypothetical protein